MSTTSSLLRQAVYELEAALDAAAREYGADSMEAQHVSDALIFMHDWLRNYTAELARKARRKGDEVP